jgi:cold shock CspA family protein
VNDKVQFNINQLKATKETNAVNIRIIERAQPVENKVEPSSPPREKKESAGRLGTPQRGYVAALKDGFGFIETLQHDKEIFFHFSNVEGKAEKLEVGQEVEYSIYSREKGGKVSAEGVKPLSKGAIPKAPCKEDVLNGKVMRPLRSVNPDQADYCGLIVAKSEDGTILGELSSALPAFSTRKNCCRREIQ